MDESSSLQTQALQPLVYELGVAVYVAQQFETSLLLLVSLLTANEGMVTAESFKNGAATYSKKTLGQLAGVFQAKLSLPSNYEEYIRHGVETRNKIMHGFVMRNTARFLSVEGRSEIIDELRDAQHIINDRLQSLNAVLDRALQVFGGSLDQLQREAHFRFEPDVIDEITRH